ncbi:TPA: penicillin-binding protein [Patescibacteria group bacterium]|uniref:Penicillin-binding protein n=1 Tax=Candidatus Gottesmanbacteria bacterium GW2011_GWA1_43_11 TaxID=1618436 RepID=A0A0G1CK32_9BACT|nr:MAG: Penicillin-binding protein [Candidatus Gottesmanbacteria bacterium GW2011_GWA1_43_11]HCS78804.1 penicillin-binding protein [Patescibacteria group bacterium]
MKLSRKKSAFPSIDIFTVKSIYLRFILILLAAIGSIVIYLFQKAVPGIKRWLRSGSILFPQLPDFILKLVQQILLLVAKSFRTFVSLFRRIHLPQISFKLPHFHLRIRTDPSSRQLQVKVPRLRPLFFRWVPSWLLSFSLGVIITLLLVFIPYNLYLFVKYLPHPRLLTQRFIPVTTQIFDRSGNLLYEIHGDEDRTPIPLTEIPEMVKQATIAIEDTDFYKHNGFSTRGIIRAIRETVFKKNIQGGSTLTQQLIKNSLLTPEITVLRKLREIALAVWTERIYTKDQILEMYLNQVPYGGTAWGIEAAAQRYFGKSSKEVNLAEAALLAGLPAAPSIYSPHGARPQLAKERQHEVLLRMVKQGFISQEQANAALSVALAIRPEIADIKAPHFVMYIKELVAQKYSQRLIDQGGLRITTTLDLGMQEKVQSIVTSVVASLKNLQVGNGAALITNPKNGDILVMVGSKDYSNVAEQGNVNVTLAQRQPGSSIKVVNYAAAFEQGMTATTTIEDAPITYTTVGAPPYSPVNYDSRFHGTVTIRQALGNSYNVPAVKVLSKVGVSNMIDMGERLGITTWTDRNRFGLALTLGGGEVTMLDMATVYGVLANSGKRVDLNPLLEIKDFAGRTYYTREAPKPKEVISSGISFILSHILADNSVRSAAFGQNSQLVIPGKTVAVKTGTTNEKRDNWTIGYTPSLVTVVWVGNNDNTPMNQQIASGITGATPIWNQIMNEVLKNKADEPLVQPEDVVTLPCNGKTEYFVKGTEPKGGCPQLPHPSTTNSPTLTPQPTPEVRENRPRPRNRRN